MSNEWIIGNRLPFLEDVVFQVQTTADDVRECRRIPNRDWSTLWFTDCTHPTQNAICHESNIKTWKIKAIDY